MPFSLEDLFDGTISCGLKVHLSQMPLTKPYRLDTLVEATFQGYEPADFVSIYRQGYDSGYAYVEGYAVFKNSKDEGDVKVIGAWLTAPFNGVEQLLSAIDPFPGGGIELPPGATTLQTRWTSFARP